MPRIPVSIADTNLLNWHALPTDVDDNVPGPVWKVLTTDPETGASTYLIHLPPGWRDDVLDWHPHTEEGFLLTEWRSESSNRAGGAYLYRQPGYLHGPAICPPYDAVTIVQRLSKPLQILRYGGTKYPHVNGQAVTEEHVGWPVDQVRIESEDLPWEDSPAGGGWACTRYKWLHRNKVNGGGCALLDIPAGWQGTGSPGRGPVEEFVVEGAIVSDGERYVKWGYVCRAAGKSAGSYESPDGCRLLCWWDEGSELE